MKFFALFFLILIHTTCRSIAASTSGHVICNLELNDISRLCRVQLKDGTPATNINYTSIAPTTIQKTGDVIEIKVKDEVKKIKNQDFQTKLCKKLPKPEPVTKYLGMCTTDVRRPICSLNLYDLQSTCRVRKYLPNERVFNIDYTTEPLVVFFGRDTVEIQVGKKAQSLQYNEYHKEICDKVPAGTHVNENASYLSDFCS